MYHQQEIGEGLTAVLASPEHNAVFSVAQHVDLPGMTYTVAPVGMVQQQNQGTNRQYQQEYEFTVRVRGGDALLEEVQRAFDAIMGDPYLKETCWHSQVTEVVLGQGIAFLTVVAKRSELTCPTRGTGETCARCQPLEVGS